MDQTSSDEEDPIDSQQFNDEYIDTNEPLLSKRVDQKFVDQVGSHIVCPQFNLLTFLSLYTILKLIFRSHYIPG